MGHSWDTHRGMLLGGCWIIPRLLPLCFHTCFPQMEFTLCSVSLITLRGNRGCEERNQRRQNLGSS